MNKKSNVRIATVLCGFGLFVLTLNAFWTFNEPPRVISTGDSEAIRVQVVDSASLLLQSTADAYLFMNEVEQAELRGLDFGAAQLHVQLALQRLVQARQAMERVIQQTIASGVSGERRRSLREFDYTSISEQCNLNGEIMGKVAGHLVRGDIIGLYRQHVANLKSIEALLTFVDGELGQGRRPENDRLWPVLQLYNETLLLANYATLVFYRT